MHFAIFMFVICVAILIIVSFTDKTALTSTERDKKLEGLTFQTITAEQRAAEKNNYALIDVVVSVVLVVVIIGILLYFRG